MEKKIYHRTTSRVLDILELISSSPGSFSLTAISQTLDVPKSSLSPILQELVYRGFLSLNSTGQYSIGLDAYNTGSSFLKQFHPLDEIEKVLINMTNICDEASHFCILSGGDVLYLKKVNSSQPIRMISFIGNKIPAYSTAIGKALLLDYSLDQIKNLYPAGLTKITDKTITDFNVLFSQLEEARKTGFALEIEESNQYIRCVATPIRKHNKVVAAISIATPIFRYSPEKEALIKSLLDDGRSKIEKLMENVEIDFRDMI